MRIPFAVGRLNGARAEIVVFRERGSDRLLPGLLALRTVLLHPFRKVFGRP